MRLAPETMVVLGSKLRWKNSNQMWLKMSQNRTMILNDFIKLEEIRRVHIFTLHMHKLLLIHTILLSGMDGVGRELRPLCPVLCLLHY